MLFHMYQVFSSLQGHLHYLHFSFIFKEYFVIDQPISALLPGFGSQLPCGGKVERWSAESKKK